MRRLTHVWLPCARFAGRKQYIWDTSDVHEALERSGHNARDLIDIVLHVDEVVIDTSPQLRVEVAGTVHDTPAPMWKFVGGSSGRKLRVRAINEGWCDLSGVTLDVTDGGTNKLLPKVRLLSDGTIGAGEHVDLELDFQEVDVARVRAIQEAKSRREIDGFENGFEEQYRSHLARLQEPIVRINEVRYKNYLKMTKLGRAWEYNPAPLLPRDTPELRESFRQSTLAGILHDCWPEMALIFDWTAVSSLGQRRKDSTTDYVADSRTRIVIARDGEFAVAVPWMNVDPRFVPVVLCIDTGLVEHDLRISDVERSSSFGVLVPAEIAFTANRSCSARVVVELVLAHDTVIAAAQFDLSLLIPSGAKSGSGPGQAA